MQSTAKVFTVFQFGPSGREKGLDAFEIDPRVGWFRFVGRDSRLCEIPLERPLR